jgi:hypothetical protein
MRIRLARWLEKLARRIGPPIRVDLNVTCAQDDFIADLIRKYVGKPS